MEKTCHDMYLEVVGKVVSFHIPQVVPVALSILLKADVGVDQKEDLQLLVNSLTLHADHSILFG